MTKGDSAWCLEAQLPGSWQLWGSWGSCLFTDRLQPAAWGWQGPGTQLPAGEGVGMEAGSHVLPGPAEMQNPVPMWGLGGLGRGPAGPSRGAQAAELGTLHLPREKKVWLWPQ